MSALLHGKPSAALVSRTEPTMEVRVLDRMDEVDTSLVMGLPGCLRRFCAATQETRR